MKIINQTTKYPLNPYQVSKFELDQRSFNKMKYRVRKGNFDKWKKDFDNWEYKFTNNDLHIIRKELGITFVIIHFEKEKKSVIAKSALIVPQMDSYIEFNRRLDLPFEEKIRIFLAETFQLLQSKIKPFYTINNPKFYPRKECEMNLRYSLEDYNKIKNIIRNGTYKFYEWGFVLNNNWFGIYHIGAMGFLIKAQFEKEGKGMVIKRAFIYPKIGEAMYGKYIGKESIGKTAEVIISTLTKELLEQSNIGQINNKNL